MVNINLDPLFEAVAKGKSLSLSFRVSGFIALDYGSITEIKGTREVSDDHVVRTNFDGIVSNTKRGDLYLTPKGYKEVRTELILILFEKKPTYNDVPLTIQMIDDKFREHINRVRVKPKPYKAYPEGLVL
jgi:hypothetical protein